MKVENKYFQKSYLQKITQFSAVISRRTPFMIGDFFLFFTVCQRNKTAPKMLFCAFFQAFPPGVVTDFRLKFYAKFNFSELFRTDKGRLSLYPISVYSLFHIFNPRKNKKPRKGDLALLFRGHIFYLPPFFLDVLCGFLRSDSFIIL